MTDKKLTPFDGRDVRKTTIAVTNAGDGLSEALGVEPREFHHGEVVYVVLETTCVKVNHVPADRDELDGDLVRQHTLRAGRASIIDAGLVADIIEDQQRRIDEHRGVQALPLCTCTFDDQGERLVYLSACTVHDIPEEDTDAHPDVD